ncbi:hypothetical protein M5K25_010135 [Dendrobium thyrsiflorum]|uniref:Aminotransferase-like plant mobile domain-containing protein n=1 Tax=Dendrobium thyrsiflorum TaxID=117978 RepID=A0ABD0UZU1_DENTH
MTRHGELKQELLSGQLKEGGGRVWLRQWKGDLHTRLACVGLKLEADRSGVENVGAGQAAEMFHWQRPNDFPPGEPSEDVIWDTIDKHDPRGDADVRDRLEQHQDMLWVTSLRLHCGEYHPLESSVAQVGWGTCDVLATAADTVEPVGQSSLLSHPGIYEVVYASLFDYRRLPTSWAHGLVEFWDASRGTFWVEAEELTLTISDLQTVSRLSLWTPFQEHSYLTAVRALVYDPFDLDLPCGVPLSDETAEPSLVAGYPSPMLPDVTEDLFLARFLATWLCTFVLPLRLGLIHYSALLAASQLSEWQHLSLAPSVFARIYRSLCIASKATSLELRDLTLPWHYLYEWIHLHILGAFSCLECPSSFAERGYPTSDIVSLPPHMRGTVVIDRVDCQRRRTLLQRRQNLLVAEYFISMRPDTRRMDIVPLETHLYAAALTWLYLLRAQSKEVRGSGCPGDRGSGCPGDRGHVRAFQILIVTETLRPILLLGPLFFLQLELHVSHLSHFTPRLPGLLADVLAPLVLLTLGCMWESTLHLEALERVHRDLGGGGVDFHVEFSFFPEGHPTDIIGPSSAPTSFPAGSASPSTVLKGFEYTSEISYHVPLLPDSRSANRCSHTAALLKDLIFSIDPRSPASWIEFVPSADRLLGLLASFGSWRRVTRRWEATDDTHDRFDSSAEALRRNQESSSGMDTEVSELMTHVRSLWRDIKEVMSKKFDIEERRSRRDCLTRRE